MTPIDYDSLSGGAHICAHCKFMPRSGETTQDPNGCILFPTMANDYISVDESGNSRIYTDGTTTTDNGMGYWVTKCPHYAEYADQTAKADAGKPKLSLVPPQIIYDIAKVREYGCRKYPGDRDNWKTVDIERYRDAMLRHAIAYMKDFHGLDEESGLPHLAHLACNIAFLCELERRDDDE